MKVDIQGAEIGMFKIATDEELRSIRQVMIEFHDFIYPLPHNRVEAIKKRMADIGFWVLPFSMDNTGVLFINKNLGVSRARIAWLKGLVKYSRGVQRKLARAFLGREVGEVAVIPYRTPFDISEELGGLELEIRMLA